MAANVPKLTLYRLNGACSLIPHALLHHYNIPFSAIRMRSGPDGFEAADGSFTNAEYRKIHHMGYVPALVVDDEVITELPAVVGYISSLVPDKNLLGVTALEKARVTEWLAWISGTVHTRAYGMMRRPGRFNDDPSTFDGIRTKGREIVDEAYARIDGRLQGKEFAVGNALTVVDFTLYIFYRWILELEVHVETVYPSLYKHGKALEKLQGVKKVLEVEQLDAPDFSFPLGGRTSDV
ncbi:hypothetical protein CEP54_002858 [Fusarium duplospermum]|uniref:GST C-terminal domain-containing protein n=1 Tax=Fusarium duplospermum TaxID=1325734 RepID=A0A428QSN5_9HYPO|nr:hypothetical protein CEP54_002858 [Fusarium duplospermum]